MYICCCSGRPFLAQLELELQHHSCGDRAGSQHPGCAGGGSQQRCGYVDLCRSEAVANKGAEHVYVCGQLARRMDVQDGVR